MSTVTSASSNDGIPSGLRTTRETAELLRVSERTLFTLTQQGKIKATRINRRVLYSLPSIHEFIDANTSRDGVA